MSPEFLALLDESAQIGSWFILLPICIGFLALIVSAKKSGKAIAFLYITLLAIASIALPTMIFALWWGELADVATSNEEIEWIYNHDGGGHLVGPVYATFLASIFWLIAVLILSVRIVIAQLRKAKKKREQLISAKESS